MVQPSSNLPKMSPHHYGIYVPDLESSIKWYQEKLDFTVHRRSYAERISAKIAFIKNGDYYIELLQVDGSVPRPEGVKINGPQHVGFLVEDYPKFMEIVRQRGVEVVKDSKFGTVSVAILKDNAGNTFEIVEKVIPDYYEG